MPNIPDLSSLPTIAETIRSNSLWTKKSFGQHFLTDPNLLQRIVREAGDISGKPVLEIGPGPGGLTRALLGAGATVTAIEKDPDCIAVLQPLVAASAGRLTLKNADALTISLADLFSEPCHIVANLPYNISTPLLLHWFGQLGGIASMTLMFQKEVAERLIAQVGDPLYGRLSVITQFHCAIQRGFDIDAKAFVPPPKVTSSVITLVPRQQPLAAVEPAMLERVTAAAFGQRRKMLRASLKSLVASYGAEVVALLESLNIRPTDRAENLSVTDFCTIAVALHQASTTAS